MLSAVRLSSRLLLGAEGSTFLFLLASSPASRVLLAMIFSTWYREMSKFVTAFRPRNLIAAMSYASAASSWVPKIQCHSVREIKKWMLFVITFNIKDHESVKQRLWSHWVISLVKSMTIADKKVLLRKACFAREKQSLRMAGQSTCLRFGSIMIGPLTSRTKDMDDHACDTSMQIASTTVSHLNLQTYWRFQDKDPCSLRPSLSELATFHVGDAWKHIRMLRTGNPRDPRMSFQERPRHSSIDWCSSRKPATLPGNGRQKRDEKRSRTA